MAEKSDVFTRVGRRIASALDEAGMNQVGLAKAMKVSEATVSRWINGDTPIDVEQIDRIARLLGKPPYYFIDLEPPNPDHLFGDKFRHLSDDDKDAVRALIDHLDARRRRQR